MRYVLRNGQLVPKHLVGTAPVARSHLPAPMLIRDCMDATVNPVNGQLYESKRAYQKAVRAAGCEIMGTDAPGTAPPPNFELPGVERDVAQAMEQLGA